MITPSEPRQDSNPAYQPGRESALRKSPDTGAPIQNVRHLAYDQVLQHNKHSLETLRTQLHVHANLHDKAGFGAPIEIPSQGSARASSRVLDTLIDSHLNNLHQRPGAQALHERKIPFRPFPSNRYPSGTQTFQPPLSRPLDQEVYD